MMATTRPPGRKTYSRLAAAAARRIPTEYEILSCDLHYNYPDRFELPAANPVVAWYARCREGSALQADNWESFSDPRRTTYRGYTELQDRKEDVVDGLLREIDESSYDERLSAEWVSFLDRWYAPLRYPAHGLQMLAAYVAQMAPASRITNCAAFQTADEVRRLQRIAYRTAQLRAHGRPLDVDRHRQIWEEADELQPLRMLIERALVTYDWGEAFVVLNLVIKPLVDRLVNEELAAALAVANGDPILSHIHFSLDEDARWHRQWSLELVRTAIADTLTNTQVIRQWVARWRPLAIEAVGAFAAVAAEAPVAGDPRAMTGRIVDDSAQELDQAISDSEAVAAKAPQ
jgi:toluene monooxygenase system protein E